MMSYASLSLASPISPNRAFSERATPDLDVVVPDIIPSIDRRDAATLRELSERATPDLDVVVPDIIPSIDRRDAAIPGA